MKYTDCWWFTTTTKLHLFNSRFEFNRELKAHVVQKHGSFSVLGAASLDSLFKEAEKIHLDNPSVNGYVINLKAQ